MLSGQPPKANSYHFDMVDTLLILVVFGGITIGILVGVGVGFLICMGLLSSALKDFFKGVRN